MVAPPIGLRSHGLAIDIRYLLRNCRLALLNGPYQSRQTGMVDSIGGCFIERRQRPASGTAESVDGIYEVYWSIDLFGDPFFFN